MSTKFTYTLIILIAVLVGSAAGNAQTNSGAVTYHYEQKLLNVLIPREATLLFNDTASLFFHSRGNGIVAIDIDGRVGGPEMSYTTGPDHDGSPVIDFYRKDPLGNTYYFDRRTDALTAREMVYLRSFLYSEPPEERMIWTTIDSTRQVDGFFCLGATTNFRGRDYLAWYTPEVNLPLGPWKFRGLPGLILAVADKEGEIRYEATSIRYGLDKSDLALIAPPTKAKHTLSFEEFKTIYEKEQRRLLRQNSSTEDRDSGDGGFQAKPTVEVFQR